MTNEQVQTVLDKIRPALQADGGDVELVAVDGGVVKVKLVGACRGCHPASDLPGGPGDYLQVLPLVTTNVPD